MLSKNQEVRGVAVPLDAWTAGGMSAAQVAAAVIEIWHLIDDGLTPVLGGRGLVALYQRTLFLTAQDCSDLMGLPEARQELLAAATPAALQLLIARQTPDTAAALGVTFLQNFRRLVTSLVGPSLTERLLHNVWNPVPGGAPAQEPSP